ncbi:MAG: DNA-binding protein [Verrucomicrobia bacterium]|nr:DNA-binding protein [Verrucomicrobiota bacterium]
MVKMTQQQLAARWQMSPRTLEQWRWLGKGPQFLKIGARVLYRDEDVEDYEAAQICQNTSGPIPTGGE